MALEPTNSLQPGLQAGRQAELISSYEPTAHPKTATPEDPQAARAHRHRDL